MYSVSRGCIDMGAAKKDTNMSHKIREKKIKKKKSLGPQVGVTEESDLSGKRSNAPKTRDEIDDLFSDLKKSVKQKEKQEKEKVPTCAIVTHVKEPVIFNF
jgi:non-homologous end joining protein Ku